jgi:phosphoglycolate phosphatase-like HAD superfamily hydrolase/ADP-ribose pyrophosphatase YjhB (NUDIX family)
MIRNIIFDWSGTLVDDLPAVWQTTNHVCRQAGLEEFTLERFRAEFCLPFRDFYERVTPHVPMERLEEWFHGHFPTVQDTVIELPHARAFLEHCRGRGIRTFLLSTVHRDHFAQQCAVLGLHQFLDRPYVEILDKRAKIHELLRENELCPDETLFVGDMRHDIETAHFGGVYSCAVLTGYSGVEQLRESRPDLIVEHLGELRQILERNGWRIEKGAPDGPAEMRPIVTVGALIFNLRNQVLMIRTRKWSNLWGIPGGKIRGGEASVDALHREILEETALEVEQVRFVLVQDCIDSREFYRKAHFVLLNYTCLAPRSDGVKLNEEAEEFLWTDLETAKGMALNQPTRVLIEAVEKQDSLRPR